MNTVQISATITQYPSLGIGLCRCGCGRKTKIIKYTNLKLGRVAGQPAKFIQGHQGHSVKSLADRFWSHVNKNGPTPAHRPELGPCWLWTASLDKRGYGQINSGGAGKKRTLKAHRVSLEIHGIEIPEGHGGLHMCDTPACVNPSHLFTGTNEDNRLDAISKRRIPHSSDHHSTKFTADIVKQIRSRYVPRIVTHKMLAQEFEVAETTIKSIIQGRNWKYV